ncbi:sensor histidine kinase [Parabacteroides sp. 52]|uniref:sensor histidine kinase n=1 Tax=unclassified Parabacteroides TaxID=2649774 RepID=UPI0013CFE3E4|nr:MULTISPECIES: HAMP domain-containing sensor histidine kinase [unclassified Parabacteroides]MDH6535351.1 two-component system, sporulation sensor kinase D [Parabacteroides sp. PM5-20]NDV56021.1 sensor histidine kinase [Parabacteroides sp. 52]
MNSIYDSRQRLKFVFIIVAMAIAAASLVASDILVKNLAKEERQKMELWAEAMKILINSQEKIEDAPMQDMTLVLKIVEENTTIPLIQVDENDSILSVRNLGYEIPVEISENDSITTYNYQDNVGRGQQENERKRLEKLKAKRAPIVIDLGDTREYLYYDDSIILKRLNIYPYVQLTILFVFVFVSFLALASTKKAEQNKVWVGLSKETAHQLGTPISSLIAWVEYLKTKEIDPALLNEMNKDVVRLETIADRFSKIGSNPEPIPVNINHSILSALDYMHTRISSKVKIHTILPDTPTLVQMNDALFAWVVENLVKNAVDAMDGQGDITFKVEEVKNKVRIDVSDTGKGIAKSKFKTVFSPGYTTKARGWGLGLSLVKRIIESYHKGHIFVKSSEAGKGTTFRIELKKYGH